MLRDCGFSLVSSLIVLRLGTMVGEMCESRKASKEIQQCIML